MYHKQSEDNQKGRPTCKKHRSDITEHDNVSSGFG